MLEDQFFLKLFQEDNWLSVQGSKANTSLWVSAMEIKLK